MLCDVSQRLPVSPYRQQQYDEILYAPAKYSADQNPQRPRQGSELCCEHRPNQRSRPGDRSKVMSENNPFVRGKKIPPVLQALRRSGSLRIKPKNFSRDELAVKAISERVGANRRR